MCPCDVADDIPSVTNLKVAYHGSAIPELFQNAGSVIGKFWVYVPIISIAMVMQEALALSARENTPVLGIIQTSVVFNLFPFSL